MLDVSSVRKIRFGQNDQLFEPFSKDLLREHSYAEPRGF